MMQWPFRTTVKFGSDDCPTKRLQYVVAAHNAAAAKAELERRLFGQEVFGYRVENVVAVTGAEAAQLNLPDGCIMLLG
jgi:hypothetical protein